MIFLNNYYAFNTIEKAEEKINELEIKDKEEKLKYYEQDNRSKRVYLTFEDFYYKYKLHYEIIEKEVL